jgi:hypothetical protein
MWWRIRTELLEARDIRGIIFALYYMVTEIAAHSEGSSASFAVSGAIDKGRLRFGYKRQEAGDGMYHVIVV